MARRAGDSLLCLYAGSVPGPDGEGDQGAAPGGSATIARVDFREVQGRFTHIDARFVEFECRLSEGWAKLTVELYPWWEHPRLVEAVREGRPWGFDGVPRDAVRLVTVYASGVHEVKMSPCEEVIDWAFYEDGPFLWDYENEADVLCQRPLSFEACTEVVAELSRRLGTPKVEERFNWKNIRRFGPQGSFSLGRFPRSVFLPLLEVLQERGIEFFAKGEPAAKELPVWFSVDEEDYIVADRFEMDVPEFIHRDEWFKAPDFPPSSETVVEE